MRVPPRLTVIIRGSRTGGRITRASCQDDNAQLGLAAAARSENPLCDVVRLRTVSTSTNRRFFGRSRDTRSTTPALDCSTRAVNVQRIVPDLTVSDLDEAIRQHSGVLGLKVVMNQGWVATLEDEAGHQLTLMTTDASAELNPDVSVFVDDVHSAHRAALSLGLEIVHPLTDEDWGVTRFFYRDNSGRVVNVGTHT